MQIFEYKTEQLLPINVNKAWSFFSSPRNLVSITPSELDFKILTVLDDKEIYSGMIIDYIVRPLFGMPVRWKTKIGEVIKPLCFIDRQIAGPYKMWEHRHLFIEKGDGVLMKDRVRYQLPLGVIGRAVHLVLVRKKIEDIFSYRRLTLQKIFERDEYAAY